jgi:HEAT repeat protein
MAFRRIAQLVVALLLAVSVPAMAQSKKKPKGGEPSFDNRTLSSWIGDLTADAPYTRVAAAYAIASMGADAKPAVPVLMANLKAENATVRYTSALALGEIGPNAADAVPALKALTDDQSDDVAHMARKSLKRIIGEPSE